ncbi:MAG: hypothetical protein EOM21_13070 [Gammaproteobacteria bacterium]|nr:hypothetical protein [Gammaproteobacteria bacterium]
MTTTAPLFPLGRVLITAAADAALERRGQSAIAQTVLRRHSLGDWGDLCEEDRQANEDALRMGERLMSVYRFPDGFRLWVITEHDRSYTMVLLPEDY